MKKTLLTSIAALAIAGCSSYSELSSDVPAFALVDNDETPVASYVVCNTSYNLFGILPLCSGETWKQGDIDRSNMHNTIWFKDHCTLDENIASVKHALSVAGSDRVSNIVSDQEESYAWSLFLVSRKTLKTTCLIVKSKNGKNGTQP